ncbi:TfoX/Sxy family protein [Jeongeupia chitinilytica]|uniref:DNA transformation protein tfoX n=1 Tax=Jeongeupia chitinilytica TaxID=1041641 RepID=A0ABQ3GYV0_9NEIS|nr:TfoX/Sxy family protein [Jeongeupia chitinilytica]GHD61920.1 DNA transformation protein tfoX [Jeongeupia chitinilytica]
MRARSEYLDWLIDELAPLGPIRAKSMFGGWGLYCDEAFFAIVDDDVLYLKADDTSRAAFVAAGSRPFSYTARGKPQTMSYYTLPDAALDDSSELLRWARTGFGAALRAQAAKRRA